MLLGFGWAVIQVSQARYVGADFDSLDTLDDELSAADRELRQACQAWLSRCDDPWLRWQFSETLNNHGGLLQFHTSRNHRTSRFWDLAEFIVGQSKGSYGVLYVHDDEDAGKRVGQDHSLSYRAWRILDGVLSEHDDQLLSPLTSEHAFGGKTGISS